MDLNIKLKQQESPKILEHYGLWGLGFRPLFLAGMGAALLLMSLWIFQISGLIQPLSAWPPTLWHGHEMVFGFSGAIIAGFLLTASANWSGYKGTSGFKLQSLIFFWLLARILILSKQSPLLSLLAELCFWVDLSYLLLPNLKGKNRVFWLLLGLMTGADLLTCLDAAGLARGLGIPALHFAIGIIVAMITVISGRVLPFFTEKALPSAQVRRWEGLDRWVLGLTLAYAVLQILPIAPIFLAILALSAGSLHLLRWIVWNPWQTRKIPILSILFIGYFWLIVGFFFQAFSQLGLLPTSSATHAWTVGAIGVMIYAMVSRVSLGHTGRPIQASKAIVSGYLCVNLAALLRILPAWLPNQSTDWVLAAGIFWSLAFGLLCFQYIPVLIRPRLDGKPG